MATTNIKDVKLKIGTENQFQSKLKDLPLNTLVGTTDPIQEGELDTAIITKLNKAENALPKPTNDTTGSAGQVLKKTANGSEWGDAPSGGGKLYKHELNVTDQSSNSYVAFVYYSSQNTIISNYDSFVQALRKNRVEPLALASNYITNKTTIGNYTFTSTDSSFTIVVTGFIGDNTSVAFGQTSMTITASDRYDYTDRLTEL